MVAMTASGLCALLIGATYGGPPALTLLVAAAWGVTIIADSAQFSTAVTELSPPAYVGTALTTQTCAGFALTTLSIWLIPPTVSAVGWGWAFASLAVGPFLGVLAMLRLRLAPESAFYENVSLAQLLRLLEKGAELWGADSGAAILLWCFKEPHELGFAYRPNPAAPSLVIAFNEPFGFHFRYDKCGEKFIGLDPKADIGSVLHYLGGQPAWFPVASFVPLARAKGVVRKFVREHERHSRLKWIESSSFNYHDAGAWRTIDALCR